MGWKKRKEKRSGRVTPQTARPLGRISRLVFLTTGRRVQTNGERRRVCLWKDLDICQTKRLHYFRCNLCIPLFWRKSPLKIVPGGGCVILRGTRHILYIHGIRLSISYCYCWISNDNSVRYGNDKQKTLLVHIHTSSILRFRFFLYPRYMMCTTFRSVSTTAPIT